MEHIFIDQPINKCNSITIDDIKYSNGYGHRPPKTQNKHLLITVGPAGSGKSSIINQNLLIHDIKNYFYIDPDETRMFSGDYRNFMNGIPM